jgi:small subunit ribosomal protein S1
MNTTVMKIKNIYKALVMRIKKRKVLVDAKLKCLYYVPISDFVTTELTELLGQEINIYIRHLDPIMNKFRTASYRRAKQEIIWDEILKYYKNKKLIDGKIMNLTKGGYSVYLDIGFYAFLPSSQICEEEIDKYNPEYEGTFSFYIIGLNRLHFNIIVSRKIVMMKDISNMNQESINTINIGASLFGIVKGININGLFLYITDNYTGFIATSEVGHGNNIDLNKEFYIGKRIEAIVISIQETKINLSIKQQQVNPMLGFVRSQKIDVIFTKYIIDQDNNTIIFGHLASNRHIFCKILKEDKIITAEQINIIINDKKEITVTIKSINEESYNLTCTTKKSQKEIWNNFMIDIQANNYIVNAKVINKSKYMLFLSYLEKEIYVPITQVSLYDSKTKFDNLKTEDIVKVFIIQLDKRSYEVIGSMRRIDLLDNKAKDKVDKIIKDVIVEATLVYTIESSYAIFKLNNQIEQSVSYNKIHSIVQNLKTNPHMLIKLQVYHHDEHGNLDIGIINDTVIKSNVKTKKFDVEELLSQFKDTQK